MALKYGFLIDDGKIFDAQIEKYALKKKVCGSNIIYYMEPDRCKRLYLFEPLLLRYHADMVFEILRFNSKIQKYRKKYHAMSGRKLEYMANMAMSHNYPPTYLTQKKFYVYKYVQQLKRDFL